MRVLIVTEHASARFGGEAALPLHYFRVLRSRGIDTWLVTHSRTRTELSSLYPDDRRIHYIEDTWLHKLMWRLGMRLPDQIAYFTTGFIARVSTQLTQRRIVRRIVETEAIDVIHQPTPVSPREPSLIYGFGVPVIVGPMNGGMDYPPHFRKRRGSAERHLLDLGRQFSRVMHRLMPGKRKAACLLVANMRTKAALPKDLGPPVVHLVENGVDLGLWRPTANSGADEGASPVTFVFLGRLVGWKAVEILIQAFNRAKDRASMCLHIIGDGDQRARLEELARSLGILAESTNRAAGKVVFAGWMPQNECAVALQSADCLVLSSLLECGGAVVLEAMSMSKPVIATDWGGPADYLDSLCGILVPPTDGEALVTGFADAMTRLASSPVERERLGAHGYQKVRSEYDWEVKVDRMLEIYEHAMRNEKKPRVAAP